MLWKKIDKKNLKKKLKIEIARLAHKTGAARLLTH